jgi:uncharacterized protein (TIGR03067 family)
MRTLVLTGLMAVTICLTVEVSAGKKPPASKEKTVGTWKAMQTEKDERSEFGVFTFHDDGRFAFERDNFLDMAKGTFTVDGDVLKIMVTDAVDGSPLVKGEWPAKTKSISEKGIVFELKVRDQVIVIDLARMPIPVGAWQGIERDRKNLQGTWEYVGSEEDGKPFKDKEFDKLTFKGEKILIRGEQEYGIFTLSANRKLKALQFRFTNGMGLANLFAYELDGNKLRICHAADRVFPEDFKTQGTKRRIDEFKRVTE